MTNLAQHKKPVLGISLAISIAAAVVVALLMVTLRPSESALGLHAMPCSDLDANGYVDTNDLDIIINNFGPVPPADPAADLNGDTIVDIPNDVLTLTGDLGTFTTCQDTPAGPAPEMSLGAQGFIDCDGDDVFDHKPKAVSKPTKCEAIYDPGKLPGKKSTDFQVTVDANILPKNGYGGINLEVVGLCTGPTCAAGSLIWNPKLCDDEIVWPEDEKPTCILGGGGHPRHESTSGNSTPYPASGYVGPLVKLNTRCPGVGSYEVALVTWPHFSVGGSLFQDEDGNTIALKPTGTFMADIDGDTTADTVDVADILTINCSTPPKLPFPGDTDGDGCADENENLPKSESGNGGGRNYLNPWDYYDVGGPAGLQADGVIDLLNDILGVINHYQPMPGGDPPYDIRYDRGPTQGPNQWNMTPPDGVIDLLIDILGVINQYNPQGCL